MINIDTETVFDSTLQIEHGTFALESNLLDALNRFCQAFLGGAYGHANVAFTGRAEAVPRCRHNSCFFQQMGGE